MHVKVRLGSGLASAAGSRRLNVELPREATVDSLIERLRETEPSIAPALGSALPVLRGAHASGGEPLADGDEVALLVPVAGGASRGRTQPERRSPWP
ncbi:MAG TPA: MoaD/ThiS family protein [Thermoleophilaceae bacterium]|nr:MoaD/ThiS family protein [Thermoleophilaceae bacterium]